MESHFSSDFFIGNRQRLRMLFKGTAPIVITAHGLLQKSNDTTFPFKQDTSFWYLTGINEPDIILVMDKDQEYLIVPEREHVKAIFDGRIENELLTNASGITEIHDTKSGWKKLSARLKRAKHVATLSAPIAYVDMMGMYTNPARALLQRKMYEANPHIDLLDLRPYLARMRVIKQPAELQAIKEAVQLTVKGFKTVARKMDSFNYEYEIDAVLTNIFRNQGATYGYHPIVAAGKNACILHYDSNTAPIGSNELILMDVGAEVHGYSADISRTYYKGIMSKRQRAVVRSVNDALNFGISELQPGISFADVESKIREFIGEKLRELGLTKTITKELIYQYYPHAPHYLGLDVHDVGDYRVPLEAGMVLTLEPGIYIPEENIGVRIEDDILITPRGCEVLSAALPHMMA